MGYDMNFLKASEFKKLTNNEKAEYYEQLHQEKLTAVTADEKEELAAAYAAISDYADSAVFASDLEQSAVKQRFADARYIAEKRKKGALAVLGVLAAVAMVVIVAVISAMI